MKKNKIKRSIYLRIFSVLIATYLLLMIAFSVFFVSQEKEVVNKELGLQSSQISNRVVEILSEHLDKNNQITDMTKVKKEFIERNFYMPMVDSGEIAIFTSDYELIYSTNDYWRCSYTEYVEGNTHHQGYGLLNPNDWFSEEEVKELENYLYANPIAERVGDLDGYKLSIYGFWMDEEMIIPDKVYVTPMNADTFDEYGEVRSASGGRREDLVYKSNYENTRDLLYFEHGNIIPEYKSINNNQIELRQMVTDPSNLKESIQELPYTMLSIERIHQLTYRYYMIVPYQSSITVMDDDSYHSDFWTTVGVDINLWERASSTLVYVWISCLIVFIIASYILSKQTYKTYLKQEELKRQRKEMTDALAHDLKTPLSIISGYAQNLQEDVHTEKRDHYASQINANVDRMDKIIRKMLEMTRLDSDSFSLNLEEVTLGEICTKVINFYKLLCEEKSITLSLEGDATVKADQSLMERVVDNFIINAIYNTPEDGEISIKVLDDILEVYNSGSHIDEDIIEEIWFPYKKGNAERSNTKGTGLGLSISRTILSLHKFPYGAKNSENGVVFWFKFR